MSSSSGPSGDPSQGSGSSDPADGHPAADRGTCSAPGTTPPPPLPQRLRYSSAHQELRSLLGAWALHACSGAEAEDVEQHLAGCQDCALEAARLREAVQWLSPPDPLEIDAGLRDRVLRNCLGHRPAQVPVPSWARPYAAETARLDALLRSLGPDEWGTSVQLNWHSGSAGLTLCGTLAHLGCVDGLVATTLGLPDPLGEGAPRGMPERTAAAAERCSRHSPEFVRNKWRNQTQAVVRAAAQAGESAADLIVDFGGAYKLPLRDAMLARAFACWVHADDIARAVDYPHPAPAGEHLAPMIDLVARMIPTAVAGRRRQGLAESHGLLVEAGRPGRSVRIEVEGPGGGDWYVPLDSPSAVPSRENSAAHIALDSVEFCQLAAGHRDPEEIAAGVEGDEAVARDVLRGVASLSRI